MARNSSFYFAFLFLPPTKRRAITAVFDFCRAVDDSVDVEPDPVRAEAALATWRQEVARVFGGRVPETIQGRQLQPFVAACQLPRDEFEALIDGVAMDVVPRRYASFADLESYCHRVASSVGLMCAAIFGARDAEVDTYARELGVALQLTNILRDVAADFRIGRCYLPTEDFERFGCTEHDLAAEVDRAGQGIGSVRVRTLLEHHAARARLFFSRALRSRPRHHVSRFVAAEIMRAIYWDLLRRIEVAGCDVFTAVIRVPRSAQAGIALKTWWKLK